MRKGIFEKQLPQAFGRHAVTHQLQKPVKSSRHRHHFGQRCCRVDPVEQRERQLRVLADIGGNAVFAHPARLLALDRRRHQIVGHHPRRDDERRFPPQIESEAARFTAKRIAPGPRHPDAARGIGDDAVVREMRQKSRLPPRAPAIGAAFVAEIGSGGELASISSRSDDWRGVGLWSGFSMFLNSKSTEDNRYG